MIDQRSKPSATRPRAYKMQPDSSLDVGPPVATVYPLLLTVAQTQRVLAIGKTSVFHMLDTGQLERRKIGRATRITTRSVLRAAGLDEPPAALTIGSPAA